MKILRQFSLFITMQSMSWTVLGLAVPDVKHEAASKRATISRKITESPDKSKKRPRRRILFEMLTAYSAVAVASLTIGNDTSWALSPEQASTDYDAYAPSYDGLDGGQASVLLGIDEARTMLFQKARGDVLEIGAGTGLNLAKYDASHLKSLTLLDISDGMLQKARLRAQSLSSSMQSVPIRFVRADATTSLVEMFGPNSFDTVVDSFSLCVMGNTGARQCLEQISRVVKSQDGHGHILLLENTRSTNPLLGLYQDATAEAAASAGGKGCVYNQDVAAMIQKSTPKLAITSEVPYAAGLFRAFEVIRVQ